MLSDWLSLFIFSPQLIVAYQIRTLQLFTELLQILTVKIAYELYFC